MKNTFNRINYDNIRRDEIKIIQYINKVWSKGKWNIKLSSFLDDMNGIDAEGIGTLGNKGKESVDLLVQIKSSSWLKLSNLEKRLYCIEIKAAMIKKNPNAHRRLIVVHKFTPQGSTSKKVLYKIYNYSIDKQITLK